jgi:hypothetical protein
MRYSDYIKTLESLKLANEDRIIGIIPEFESFAYDALIEWMENSLEIKAGSLIATDETNEILNQFDSAYLKFITKLKSYKGAVTSFVKELPKMGTIMQHYQEGTNGIDWSKANIGPTQKLVVGEIINAYTENGLNTEFVQPLRDLLYQNIAAGTNMADAKKQLNDYIVGPGDKSGKLKSYLTQTSQQAVDSYTGAINKKLMDTFDYSHLIMSGSLIATSSTQCRYGINNLDGIIKVEDWPALKEMADNNGLVKGTTFKNLPFNKLHWGCRHEFTPAMLKDGDQIGVNENIINGVPEKIKPGNAEKIKKQTVSKQLILTADPLLIGPMKSMYDTMKSKVAPLVRKNAMNNFLRKNNHDVVFENKKQDTKIFSVEGAKYSEDELQSYIKLANAGKHVIIPNISAFEKRKDAKNNDAFIVDKKTFYNEAIELKRITGSGSLKTFISQLGKAGEQANVVVVDILPNLSPYTLMQNLRAGWNNEIKKILVYYRGQFRELDRNILYNDKAFLNLIK